MKQADTQAARGTQLIARSATLLRLIANTNHQGARLVDLTLHSGLERPTVRRILQGWIGFSGAIQKTAALPIPILVLLFLN